jgi:raffinose/stachyose/melibiose transport system permease protein
MFIFRSPFGLNHLLEKAGVQNPPLWLMDTKGTIILPMWVIAFVALWQYVGQSMMLYMAQISGISKSLMEASYIDGCTKPMTFRYVTLPLIKPMVATAMSLNAIGSLKFFDLIFNMTEGGPNHKTEVLATHLYQQGFKYSKYGYASAIGVVLLILCLAVTLFINKVVKTEQYEM